MPGFTATFQKSVLTPRSSSAGLTINLGTSPNVPVAQSVAMAAALRDHGKDAEAFVVTGATHYFTEQQNAIARRKLFDFLRRHLIRS